MPSYSPVFSAQFIVSQAGTPLVPFVVPEGFTAVMRQVTCFTGIGGTIVEVSIQDASSAPSVRVASFAIDGTTAYGQWQGRVALPAPGIINVEAISAGDEADIYVGGYLLRNTVS